MCVCVCVCVCVSDNKYTMLAELFFITNSKQLMFMFKCVVIPL